MALNLSAENTTVTNAIPWITFFAYSIVLPLICIIGIIGNICNLITLRSPALQAVSYIYLRALAVADLTAMLFIIPFVLRVTKLLPSSYFAAWYGAHLELPFINTFIGAGVLIIVALTVERYVSVVWPTHFRRWNTPLVATSAITIAYVLSIILYVPYCFKKHVVAKNSTVVTEAVLNQTTVQFKFGPVDNEAIISRSEYKAYQLTREILLRVLPILVLSYCNIHIIVEFRRIRARRVRMLTGYSTGSDRGHVGPGRQTAARDDSHLMVLMAAIVILFFICNTPAAINTAYEADAFSKDVSYQIFRATANLLEIANHAVNFYMFCMCSRDYRNEFLKIFPCIRQLKRFSTFSTATSKARKISVTGISGANDLLTMEPTLSELKLLDLVNANNPNQLTYNSEANRYSSATKQLHLSVMQNGQAKLASKRDDGDLQHLLDANAVTPVTDKDSSVHSDLLRSSSYYEAHSRNNSPADGRAEQFLHFNGLPISRQSSANDIYL